MPYWPNDISLKVYCISAEVASPSGTPFFGTRLMMAYGGHNVQAPVLLSVVRSFGTWELSFLLEYSTLLIKVALFLTLDVFGGTGNFILHLSTYIMYHSIPQTSTYHFCIWSLLGWVTKELQY